MTIIQNIIDLVYFLITKLGDNPIFYYTSWLFVFILVVKFFKGLIWQ